MSSTSSSSAAGVFTVDPRRELPGGAGAMGVRAGVIAGGVLLPLPVLAVCVDAALLVLVLAAARVVAGVVGGGGGGAGLLATVVGGAALVEEVVEPGAEGHSPCC